MVYYLTGPTGSGKTSLSIEMAKALNCEIVNCDALQIYQGLDIGTAKPTPEEQSQVPHHLLDLIDPLEEFSVADYQAMADQVIEEIQARGKEALVVGGTLQYLQSLRYDYDYEAPPSDPTTREKFEAEARQYGSAKLHERLQELDPERAAKVHPNDQLRVVRALEIIELSGRKASSFALKKRPGKWWGSVIALMPERAWLYERINRRVDQMLEAGLLDEAKRFYDLKPEPRQGAAKAIGYKELFPYFAGEATLDACVENLKMQTRRFAKRQMTGIRGLEDVSVVHFGKNDAKQAVLQEIFTLISNISD